MTLDQKILEEVGNSFREQGLLLQLGQAWVDRTGGEVIPGVFMGAQEYVKLLRSVPLYAEVKGDLDRFVLLSRIDKLNSGKHCTSEEYNNCLLLRHLPTVREVLRIFLLDPDFHGTTPYEFMTVLRLYDPKKNCILEDGIGPGHTARNALRNIISKDQLLEFCGIRLEWENYTTSVGMSKHWRTDASKVLRRFLSDPDYDGARAYTLSHILSKYDLNTGSLLKRGHGLGNNSRTAFKSGLSDEQFLDLCGLRVEWVKYKKTPGISREYKESARLVLKAFLLDPDYNGTRPYDVSTVLQMYDPKSKLMLEKGNSGPGINATNAFKRGISKNRFLDICGLREQWDLYQRTPGISREYRLSATKVLRTFLSSPEYYRTRPYSLTTVLNRYDPESKGMLKCGRSGLGKNSQQAISRNGVSQDKFLDICGLRAAWDMYQSSSSSNPFVLGCET